MEDGVLKAEYDAFALQGGKSRKLKAFTLVTDVVFKEHKQESENYLGMWIGANLAEKKVTMGYCPKENKVKIIYENKVLKEATVPEIGLNKQFNLAFKLTSDGVIQIYIDKQLVLEDTNKNVYVYDNIIVFWNSNNIVHLDNMILADEFYPVKK